MKFSWYATALFLSLAACTAAGHQASADARPDGSAIVVQGSDLSGSVIDALRSRVAGMTISNRSGECPQIMFRGPRSVRNQRNPTVYVDGTMMLDTCILQQINAADVDRIELYPSGIISKPAIQRDPFGIIMVYRKNR